ncbi:hypothetical protein BP5796_05919 [Coleophoma crateriformis]|uniref:SHSP domain-containing protein n=1 Tax=Coleophoma crateriformis TaxID=565419 RepID=A0A3D8RVH8_9HELO|nr:hypothetical protein BP5796_05919 [Coleophoma crateriformis]
MAFNNNNNNDNNNNAQAPQGNFWDWVRNFDNTGAGVDHTPQVPGADFSSFEHPHHPRHHHHPPPFPFGGPGPFGFGGPFGEHGFGRPRGDHHGPRGFGPRDGFGPQGHDGGPRMGRCRGRGRHGCHHRSGSKTPSGSGSDSESSESEVEGKEVEEAEEGKEGSPRRHGHKGKGKGKGKSFGRHGRRGGRDEEAGPAGEGRGFSPRGHGRHGGRRGRHGFGGPGFGGPGFGGRHHRGPPPPFPFGGPGGSFDLSGLLNALGSHPIAQAVRGYAEQAAGGQQSSETLVPTGMDVDAENSFTPPIDIFTTETSYVLHVALPGAKKEDVGVNWDADKSVLNVAGVVYRQGDEDFLKSLSKSERKVGVFERTVKLPPSEEEKEEVDADNITAKLEDGVLVVTVPKIEREWTEVKKVDIV